MEYKCANMRIFDLSLQTPIENDQPEMEGAMAPPASPTQAEALDLSKPTASVSPSISYNNNAQMARPCALAAQCETSNDLDRMVEAASRAATLPRANHAARPDEAAVRPGTPIPKPQGVKRRYDDIMQSPTNAQQADVKRKRSDVETGENVSLFLIKSDN